MSGNPFRRPPQAARAPEQAAIGSEQQQHLDSGADAVAASTSKTKSGKPKKRVQIVSPPQSPVESPHIQRRVSDGASGSPPPPPLTTPVGEEVESTESDLEQAVENTRQNSNGSEPLPPSVMQAATGSRAPYNPFARTLATSEAAFGLQNITAEEQERLRQSARGPPKMNVDVFKNILMTGSASPSPPVLPQPRSQRVQDSSSSTDTSSVSRHSLFDHSHDLSQESPRTSFDQVSSSDEDEQYEHSSLMGPSGTRPEAEGPPPPPKHTHGRAVRQKGPQTVSFADFHESIPSGWQQPPGPRTPPPGSPLAGILRPSTPRSPSDLNKPLPQPPGDASSSEPAPAPVPEMASVQPPTPIIEKEEPQTKRAPPPPPTSRRQAQNSSGRARSGSNMTQNSIQEEDEETSLSRVSTLQGKVPPPPPPARRGQAASTPSAADTPPSHDAPSPAPSNENKPMPPPPPRRHHSKSGSSSIVRTPSNASRTSITRSSDTNANAPPAPPPRRSGGSSGRNSLDGAAGALSSRRWSGQEYRRASGQSETSSLRHVEESEGVVTEEPAKSEEAAPQRDMLADLAALQAEVDALRKQQQQQD